MDYVVRNGQYFVKNPLTGLNEQWNWETIARMVLTKNGTSNLEADLEALNLALGTHHTVHLVPDIDARNALTDVSKSDEVLVLDATADTTVSAGWARYIALKDNPTDADWFKYAEGESIDFTLKWSDLKDKPASSVADIDDTVAKRHAHANKEVLDLLTENSGVLQHNGKALAYSDIIQISETEPTNQPPNGIWLKPVV